MTVVDSESLPQNADIVADICVVGAGAAGITLAEELRASKHSVCLLESGFLRPDAEVQALYDLQNVGYPIRENFMSRARYFGGSCNLWAGRAMKLQPIDLAPRDWVPDSGWPLAYDELESYYGRAEKVLGLPAFAPFEAASELRDIGIAEQALLASAELAPIIALWGRKPMRFGSAFKPRLSKSANVVVYLNANVTEVLTNDSGSAVEKLEVKTLGGKRFTARAKHYVLACGGLENARLLLVSRGRHANGIGNDHDLVGRYYLDHPRVLFGSVRLHRPINLPYLLGMPLSDGKVQLGIGLSERAQREQRALNSYLSLEPQLSEFAAEQYGRTVNVMKVLLRKGHAGSRMSLSFGNMSDVREMIYLLTPKELMPHFVYRYYAMAKRAIRKKTFATHLTVINYCEQAPNRASRVYLNERRDRLGMSMLTLDWRVGSEEARSVASLHSALAAWLKKSGIGALEKSAATAELPKFTDASHHLGTTRMSDDRRRGVVDKDCKVHGIANLFVAGSAVFPTAGHANPTLTIVALSLRLSDHLKRIHSGNASATASAT